jgi:hypothetical protein
MSRKLSPNHQVMKLSAPEQRLLDFAREQFGEHLSQFLLTGLGERQVGQRGRFTISYASGVNAALKRHVEVITYEPADGSSYLPRARNPIVLLALLYLLMNGNQGSLNVLHYEQEDVLSLLGWKDTHRSRREIEEAVERYFLLMYKWKMNKSELHRDGLTFFTANEAMISAHESIDTGDGKSARVVFSEHFIEQLLSRSLFGVDWNNARSVLLKSPSRK